MPSVQSRAGSHSIGARSRHGSGPARTPKGGTPQAARATRGVLPDRETLGSLPTRSHRPSRRLASGACIPPARHLRIGIGSSMRDPRCTSVGEPARWSPLRTSRDCTDSQSIDRASERRVRSAARDSFQARATHADATHRVTPLRSRAEGRDGRPSCRDGMPLTAWPSRGWRTRFRACIPAVTPWSRDRGQAWLKRPRRVFRHSPRGAFTDFFHGRPRCIR